MLSSFLLRSQVWKTDGPVVHCKPRTAKSIQPWSCGPCEAATQKAESGTGLQLAYHCHLGPKSPCCFGFYQCDWYESWFAMLEGYHWQVCWYNITFLHPKGSNMTQLPTPTYARSTCGKGRENIVGDPWHLPPSHRRDLQQTFSFPAAFQLPMSLSHQATCLPFHLRRRDCGAMCTHKKWKRHLAANLGFECLGHAIQLRARVLPR